MPSHTPSISVATPALEVESLVKSYNGRRAVDGLTFNAARGEITAVLGPNGAGKTTAIECCEGLRVADSGTIRVLGKQPGIPEVRERVGVMLQDGGLPTGVRSVEMLHHVAAMHANPVPIGELVERLGLGAFARTTVRRLSGGQRQRLALATALVGRPDLVFLDEPSAGMDPQSRHAVWELISELRDDGVSFVLTTHLMDEAEALADHVVIVDHGTVIARGTVAELTRSMPGSQDTDEANTASPHPPNSAEATTAHSVDATTTLRWTTRPRIPLQTLIASWQRLSSSGATYDCNATELEPGTYSATIRATPAHIQQIANWAAEHNALLSHVSVNQRSLEDVFLELTGRHLR